MSQWVIFGTSNILSDLFEAILVSGQTVRALVLNQDEVVGERDLPLAERLAAFAAHGIRPEVLAWDDFVPDVGDHFLLGPTTPARAQLAAAVTQRFGAQFAALVHPRAYVSPLARVEAGVFVGANSTVAAGAQVQAHAFINRGVTIGHDTVVESFARVQPGANVGGLTRIGRGATVGLGANVLERLVVGEGAFVGAGAVVLEDVAPAVLVVGVPARFKKTL